MMLKLSPKDARSEVKAAQGAHSRDRRDAHRPHRGLFVRADTRPRSGGGQSLRRVERGRNAAIREIDALWKQIDHLNDALKGRSSGRNYQLR
jgi:hypothetical protein